MPPTREPQGRMRFVLPWAWGGGLPSGGPRGDRASAVPGFGRLRIGQEAPWSALGGFEDDRSGDDGLSGPHPTAKKYLKKYIK